MAIGIDEPRHYVTVLGVNTAFQRRGSGRTVVLLHGGSPGACSELNWHANFGPLADAGYDVIAFDQPGFGYSDAPAEPTVAFRFRHACEFLKSQNVRSAAVIANSMGGLLAVMLDQHQREPGAVRVEGLVLAAPFPHFDLAPEIQAALRQHSERLAAVRPTVEAVQALCERTLYDRSKLSSELVNLRLQMLSGKNWSAFLERTRSKDKRVADAIRNAQVTTPSLLIWGMNDNSVSFKAGIQAMSHFSQARSMFLTQCGHWPQTEHSTIFNETVLTFLRLDVFGRKEA